MIKYFDDEEIAELLSSAEALSCVEESFRLLADGRAVNAPRQRSGMKGLVLNVMWALAPSEGVAGVKSYPIVRSDVTQGSVLTLLMYSYSSGELLAVLKADRLGQLRTGAASAVASRLLARKDAHVLAVYGTGFQALGQVLGQAQVLSELQTVLVVGRDAARRDKFIDRLRSNLNAEVRVAEPEAAARAADVICTATGSADPVVRGEWLQPGAHVNAVGSNNSDKREVDRAVFERAAVIVTDAIDVAAVDGGDFILNDWDQQSVGSLGDILTGRASGRREPAEITVFESHGLAIQDVLCAAHVLRKAGIDASSANYINTRRGAHG